MANELDVVGCMGQCQLTIAGAWGFQQAQKRYLPLKALPQHGVLSHGKPVPLRQRQNKTGGIKSFHEKEYEGSFFVVFLICLNYFVAAQQKSLQTQISFL